MINKLKNYKYILTMPPILIINILLIITILGKVQIGEDHVGQMELLQTYPLENYNKSYWFNSRGDMVAINQGEGISFIDTSTLQVIGTYKLSLRESVNKAEEQPEAVTSGGFILDDNYFVIGTSAGSPIRDLGSLLLLSTSHEEELQILENMISIENITINVDGDYLAYTREFDEVVVMAAKNRDILYTFRVDGRFGGSPVFSPTQTLLALVLQGGHINLVNLEQNTIDTIIPGLIAEDVIFSPSGAVIAIWDDKAVELWNVNTLEKIANFEISSESEGSIADIAINLSENKLIMGGSQLNAEGNLIVFDSYFNDPLLVIDSHTHSVFNVIYDPTNKMLASADRIGNIKIWDVKNFDFPTYEANMDWSILHIDFSPNGEYIFAQTATELTIWDIVDKE